MPRDESLNTPEDLDRILQRIQRRWDSSLLDKDKQISIWDDTWMIGETDAQEQRISSEED